MKITNGNNRIVPVDINGVVEKTYLLYLVARNKRLGEDAFDTLKRLVIVEALKDCKEKHCIAAMKLGISKRVMSYYIGKRRCEKS
jgi:hypothetical protein